MTGKVGVLHPPFSAFRPPSLVLRLSSLRSPAGTAAIRAPSSVPRFSSPVLFSVMPPPRRGRSPTLDRSQGTGRGEYKNRASPFWERPDDASAHQNGSAASVLRRTFRRNPAGIGASRGYPPFRRIRTCFSPSKSAPGGPALSGCPPCLRHRSSGGSWARRSRRRAPGPRSPTPGKPWRNRCRSG